MKKYYQKIKQLNLDLQKKFEKILSKNKTTSILFFKLNSVFSILKKNKMAQQNILKNLEEEKKTIMSDFNNKLKDIKTHCKENILKLKAEEVKVFGNISSEALEKIKKIENKKKKYFDTKNKEIKEAINLKKNKLESIQKDIEDMCKKILNEKNNTNEYYDEFIVLKTRKEDLEEEYEDIITNLYGETEDKIEEYEDKINEVRVNDDVDDIIENTNNKIHVCQYMYEEKKEKLENYQDKYNKVYDCLVKKINLLKESDISEFSSIYSIKKKLKSEENTDFDKIKNLIDIYIEMKNKFQNLIKQTKLIY